MTNKVPDNFFVHLDHKGERSDKYEKPELHKGTYDLIAPEEYLKDLKPTETIYIMICLEMTPASV